MLEAAFSRYLLVYDRTTKRLKWAPSLKIIPFESWLAVVFNEPREALIALECVGMDLA